MRPLELPCPKCNAAPFVPCRLVLTEGRLLSRSEMAKFIGNNADNEAIIDEPAGITHLARAEAAARHIPRPPPVDREALLEVTKQTERRWAKEKEERER